MYLHILAFTTPYRKPVLVPITFTYLESRYVRLQMITFPAFVYDQACAIAQVQQLSTIVFQLVTLKY